MQAVRMKLGRWLRCCGSMDDMRQVIALVILERADYLERLGDRWLFTVADQVGGMMRKDLRRSRAFDKAGNGDSDFLVSRLSARPDRIDVDPFLMLPERTRDMVREYFYAPYGSRRALADRFGISEHAISGRVYAAIAKARKHDQESR